MIGSDPVTSGTPGLSIAASVSATLVISYQDYQEELSERPIRSFDVSA